MLKFEFKPPLVKDLDLSDLEREVNEFEHPLDHHIEPGGLVEIAVRELGAEVVKIEVDLPEAG